MTHFNAMRPRFLVKSAGGSFFALLLALGSGLGLAHNAAAQSVSLGGVLGSKALLVVNGSAPRSVAVGESLQGVTVVSVQGSDGSAVVEMNGQRSTLRLGQAPVISGGKGGSPRVVLNSDSRGHFVNTGSINGRQVQFMVDTGATTVALSQAEAERLSIPYQKSPQINIGTAGGIVKGWTVQLDSVRLGDIEVFGVQATVTPHPMPYVLLGNSFLNSLQMSRQDGLMVLEKKR